MLHEAGPIQAHDINSGRREGVRRVHPPVDVSAIANQALVDNCEVLIGHEWRKAVNGVLTAAKAIWIVFDEVDGEVIREGGCDVLVDVELLYEPVERSELRFLASRVGWAVGCCGYSYDREKRKDG